MGLTYYTHQDTYTNAYLKMKEKEKQLNENYNAKIVTVDNFVTFNLNANAKNIIMREGTYTKEHLESILKLFEAKTTELNACTTCKKQKCESCQDAKECKCDGKCDCESKKVEEAINLKKAEYVKNEYRTKSIELLDKVLAAYKEGLKTGNMELHDKLSAEYQEYIKLNGSKIK